METLSSRFRAKSAYRPAHSANLKTLIGCALYESHIVYGFVCSRMGEMEAAESQPPWLNKVLRKREIQQTAISPFRIIQYPANADAITVINDIDTLAAEIRKGVFSAYDVTLAYLQR